jgi:hypothetical protein
MSFLAASSALSVVTDTGDQLPGLLCAETMLLGEITHFVILISGYATAVRFSDVVFIVGH